MKDFQYEDVLSFHFGLPFDQNASEGWSRAFYQSLGLPINSGCWAEISLNSEKFDVFIDEVRRRKKSDNANFIGFAHLLRKISDGSSSQIEWYELQPWESIWDFIKLSQINGTTVEALDAYKLPTTLNVGSGGFGNIYVSERFKATVEALGATGIKFVWLRDTGKYQSTQWYSPIALMPIGKGIDDPWFDSNKRRGSDSWQPREEPFVTGVYHFDVEQVRLQSKMLTLRHRQLFDEFRGCNLAIITPKKYSSDFTPHTDFAFNWKQEDTIRDGRAIRQRGICIRRAMKEKLVASGIPREADCVPIEVHSEWKHGPLLDKKSVYPPPLMTSDEIETISSQLDPIRKLTVSLSRPKYEMSLRKAIQLLKYEKKNRPNDFRTAARGDFVEIPQPVVELLRVSNGGNLNDEVELISRTDLQTANLQTRAILEGLFERSERYFQFAHCVNGDWVSICIDETAEDYLSVSRFDHEMSSIGYTWKHMGLFLGDMLQGFYE